MQQSPCFKLFSPEENAKFFRSFQRINNGIYSPRTIFFGLGLSSSGQNSYSNKNILSKMKFSSSNAKQIFNNSNKQIFLSNKRYHSSESPEKNNIEKTNYEKTNNENINKENTVLNTVFKNEESIIESQNDVKVTKASSKKNSTYIPNIYYNNGYCNNYNGCISNSSLIKFNNSAYIGSVKKNLLPSLSKELQSNSKNHNNNVTDNKIKINNNNSYSYNKKHKIKVIKNYNNSEYKKTNRNSYSKSNINTSCKKTSNDSTPYDYLCKTAESLDLEKMVDYIVSNTKKYNRYNDNKEYFSNNINNLINKNINIENNNNEFNNNYYINSTHKSNKKCKNSMTNSNNKSLINQKVAYSICKCKKVECLKYSCSCLKSGNKCSNLCSCMNCKNRDCNLFKIDD